MRLTFNCYAALLLLYAAGFIDVREANWNTGFNATLFHIEKGGLSRAVRLITFRAYLPMGHLDYLLAGHDYAAMDHTTGQILTR
jgi:hypothetical protein